MSYVSQVNARSTKESNRAHKSEPFASRVPTIPIRFNHFRYHSELIEVTFRGRSRLFDIEPIPTGISSGTNATQRDVLNQGKGISITVWQLFISHISYNGIGWRMTIQECLPINIRIYVSIYSHAASSRHHRRRPHEKWFRCARFR